MQGRRLPSPLGEPRAAQETCSGCPVDPKVALRPSRPSFSHLVFSPGVVWAIVGGKNPNSTWDSVAGLVPWLSQRTRLSPMVCADDGSP